MLEKEYMRAWLRQCIIPVKGGLGEARKARDPKRLTLRTIATHIDGCYQDLWNFAKTDGFRVRKGLLRKLNRFIPEWDAGMWRIEIARSSMHTKILVSVENPVPKRQFQVDITNLSIKKVQNSQVNGKMPRYLWR